MTNSNQLPVSDAKNLSEWQRRINAAAQTYFGADKLAAWHKELVEHWSGTVLVSGWTTPTEAFLLKQNHDLGLNLTPEEFAERHLIEIAADFFKKIFGKALLERIRDRKPRFDTSEIELTILPTAEATIEYNGETRDLIVSGFVQLTGAVRDRFGIACKVMAVWVGHPFHQYRAYPRQ